MKEPFNTSFSVFKNLFDSKDTPYTQSLLDVYKRIKQGNAALIDKIHKIRSEKDKEVRNKIKSSLLAILFNGKFSERSDNGLVEHSGICILDFDNLDTSELYNTQWQTLVNDKHTLMAFRSPSGNGIKALIIIPKCDKAEHKRRFEAYGDYINSEYFDKQNCNVSRVCYESYDPDCYLNQFCETFTSISEDKGFTYIEKVPVCILQDEQKKIDIIMSFNWKKGFVEGSRNAFLFDLAGAFCEYGISQTTAEGYILNNVVIGKFSEEEAVTAIKSAYKKRAFDSRYFEDYSTRKLIENKMRAGASKEEIKKSHNVSDSVIDEIREMYIDNSDIFWDVIKTKQAERINIEPFKYASFLVKNGFMKYYPENAEQPTFVRVVENKVNISSPEIIKDFVLNYLFETKNINVWNYCSKSPYLFSSSHLNMVDSVSIKMIQDTKSESYIPYRNGIVKVSESGTELISYIDVDGYIWENQILRRDFDVSVSFKNDFQDFVHKISNNDEDRIKSLETTIGYLIHSYKDKTDQKAIIFNDQEIDDNPNGGSGKSLMLNAIGYIRRMVKIDGKAFDPKKSDFVYQRVNLDTQILAFDDVKRYFNFEQLFSLITEGITVNRKNKDEIFIPFERSSKIVITTNYVINGAGNSHDRRRHEIEVYQYFNSKITPLSVYGRLLFDSWSKQDWLNSLKYSSLGILLSHSFLSHCFHPFFMFPA